MVEQRPLLESDGLSYSMLRSDSTGEVRGLRRLSKLIDGRKSELEAALKLKNDPIGQAIDAITSQHPTD